MDNSDGGERYPEHDFVCTDKLLGPNWASYVSAHPHYGFWIFEVDPGFIPRDNTSKIIDLKFVELREILILSDF
jgi:hypothetical protein